jgi:hypothetical protein
MFLGVMIVFSGVKFACVASRPSCAQSNPMKKSLFLFAILPTLAHAGGDAVDCSKKNDGSVKCEVKKEWVIIDAIVINGGDCQAPSPDKLLHNAYHQGDKFSVPIKGEGPPGFDPCSYVSSVTIKTHDGKSKTFAPL